MQNILKHNIMLSSHKLTYLIGDATKPQGEGLKVIPHICNDIGAWGAGFVLALSRRWKEPEAMYMSMPSRHLGAVQFVPVQDDIVVVNMIAQNGVGRRPDGSPPISYGALKVCLNDVNNYAWRNGATIHMPRIGVGLAGGDWNRIEQIIKDVMTVDVFVYDLK